MRLVVTSSGSSLAASLGRCYATRGHARLRSALPSTLFKIPKQLPQRPFSGMGRSSGKASRPHQQQRWEPSAIEAVVVLWNGVVGLLSSTLHLAG
jgi:hypothetical protein